MTAFKDYPRPRSHRPAANPRMPQSTPAQNQLRGTYDGSSARWWDALSGLNHSGSTASGRCPGLRDGRTFGAPELGGAGVVVGSGVAREGAKKKGIWGAFSVYG